MRGISRILRKVWFAMGNEDKLTGTPEQVKWAEQIRLTVAREFDRVAEAFQARISRQNAQEQSETLAVIAILEQKRAETMAGVERSGTLDDLQRSPVSGNQGTKRSATAQLKTPMDKRLMKRHKRHVLRARERVRLSEPDVRTPEQLKAAREASRPGGVRGTQLPPHYTMPSSAAKAEVEG
jgi:hypothetical protein